jgi:imidazolonepropionase
MSLQLWAHCRAATLTPQSAQPYGLVDDAALVVNCERLA